MILWEAIMKILSPTGSRLPNHGRIGAWSDFHICSPCRIERVILILILTLGIIILGLCIITLCIIWLVCIGIISSSRRVLYLLRYHRSNGNCCLHLLLFFPFHLKLLLIWDFHGCCSLLLHLLLKIIKDLCGTSVDFAGMSEVQQVTLFLCFSHRYGISQWRCGRGRKNVRIINRTGYPTCTEHAVKLCD